MEYSPLNAVRKDAAQQARDFLVAVLGYLYVESKRRFSNLEVIYFATVRGLAKSPPTARKDLFGCPGESPWLARRTKLRTYAPPLPLNCAPVVAAKTRIQSCPSNCR